MMVVTPESPTLLYITNPMCGWCYGFTPVIRRMRALWQGRLTVKVLLGPLQAYAAEPLQPDAKERLAVNWHRVQDRTGVPFDYRFFTIRDFVYNTEPACRALLCVRLLRPKLTLEVLRAMHSAFFAELKDLRNPAVLVDIVRPFGISENLFLTLFESEEITLQMEEEFNYVESIGADHFPSVFLHTNHGMAYLTKGYSGLNDLEQRMLRELEQKV